MWNIDKVSKITERQTESSDLEDEQQRELLEQAAAQVQRKILLWFSTILAVFVLIIAAILWAGSSALKTTMRQVGSPNSVTDDMSERDVVLRTSFVQPGRSASVPDLKLRIPRAFIVHEIGENSDIGRVRDGLHSVAINGVYNPRSQTLLPAANHSSDQLSRISIHLSNRVNLSEPAQYCLREVDYEKLTAPSSETRKCLNNKYRCKIFLTYGAWQVRLFVSKDSSFYKQPDFACRIAREFIDNHSNR